MFDNYNAAESSSEDHNTQDQNEENAFLDHMITNSNITKEAHKWLVDNNHFVGDLTAYKSYLNDIWFRPYQRGATDSSSGFEHVFIGETDGGDVGGFHGWVHLYDEETKGNIDYKGNYVYMEFDDDTSDKGYIGVTNYYTWNGNMKCKGGGFMGTSPDLDLAVYTICYTVMPNTQCPMTFNGHSFQIQTWDEYDGSVHMIGSAYPLFD